MLFDELEPQCFSFAKKAVAFFNMSRSIRSRLFSARSLASSMRSSSVSSVPFGGYIPGTDRHVWISWSRGGICRGGITRNRSRRSSASVALADVFAAMAGRNRFYPVSGTLHHARLFSVAVGGTASGRKGTALDCVLHVMEQVDGAFFDENVVSGLTSGAGLIWHVRDAMDEEDSGVTDKRLLVVEPELGGVLRACNRRENDLSAVVRNAWDGKALRTLAKQQPARATDPHISVIGHVTCEELRETLSKNDTSNGFANRILWYASRRSKLLPDGDRHVVDAVNDLTSVYYDKLVTVDLVNPRVIPEAAVEALERNLGQMIDQFIERRVDVKKATRTVYGLARASLVSFFGEKKAIADITAGDAEDFARWMAGVKKHAPATIYRRLSVCRMFFGDAVKHKLLVENPFIEVRAGERANRSRMRFISRGDIVRVVAACPDAEWRLLVLLSRIGGLRTPCESLTLKWSDIDWNSERIRVDSPKTGLRYIPLFPELVDPLLEVSELAEPGSEFVIQENRPAALLNDAGNWQNANLRTRLLRIIKTAGLEAWPKPWHNLRASRQTELCDQFPQHVVSRWLGNSEQVAREHYLQTTDEHWARAVKPGSALPLALPPGEESPRTSSQTDREVEQKWTSMQEKTATCENMRPSKIAEEGLEPPTRGL